MLHMILTLLIYLMVYEQAAEAATLQLAPLFRGLLTADKGKAKTLYSRSEENVFPRKRHNREVFKLS